MAKQIKGILGEKLGMTQVWDENNRVVPVTVVKAGPNVVTQVRTNDADGYAFRAAREAADPDGADRGRERNHDRDLVQPAVA